MSRKDLMLPIQYWEAMISQFLRAVVAHNNRVGIDEALLGDFGLKLSEDQKNFFKNASTALLFQEINTLACLLEKRDDTVNCEKFLDFFHARKDTKEFDGMRDALTALAEDRKKILALRNQFTAHLNAKQEPKQTWLQFRIKNQELAKVIDSVRSYLETVPRGFCNWNWDYPDVKPSDVPTQFFTQLNANQVG
jgi:hypothetical protein